MFLNFDVKNASKEAAFPSLTIWTRESWLLQFKLFSACMFHSHFWPQLLCFRQKSTDPGLSSSKHPFCSLNLLVSLGTNHSGMSLSLLVFCLVVCMNSVSETWGWNSATVLIDLLIDTGWRKVCSIVSNLPLFVGIKNAWKCWFSMVLWSHSSLPEWGQLDNGLHWLSRYISNATTRSWKLASKV